MKKIVFITTNNHIPWGGSEELWSKTAKNLAKTGNYKVSALLRDWRPIPKHIQELKEAGGKIQKLNSIFSFNKTADRIWKKLLNQVYNRYYYQLKSESPDLVVISLGSHFQGFEWMETCKNLAIPYINIIQLAYEYHWVADLELDEYVKGYKNAIHNYFVSEHNLRLTSRQLAVSLDNASVVRNPYKVTGKLLPYPSLELGFNMACPARLFPVHKGQDLLFEVLAQQKWKSRNINLNLYGKGTNEKSLKRLKELRQLTKIIFKGFVDNIGAIWEKNHILIMPSRMEGLPLSLIEAMLCGRTAIVTDVGGMAECIQDNITGFIAKAPTIELLDEAMERAWLKRNEWEVMGKKASLSIRELIPNDPVDVFAKEIKKYL